MTSATRPLALEDQNIREYSDQELNELRMITSPTGAALLPEGVDAQRPGEGAIPAGAAVMRGSVQTPGDYLIEFWNRSAAAWQDLASRPWVMQAINTAKSAIENWVNGLIGFTIIYPNGGTEASPANISTNQRLVETNPYPGKYVLCVAEILVSDKWENPGWGHVSAGIGVRATQGGDNNIVVQAGGSGVLGAAITAGGSVSGNLATAPVRVKIWKIL